jgi:serine/threonine protein kinase
MQDFKREKVNFKKPLGDLSSSVFSYEDFFAVKQIIASNPRELRTEMHNIVLNSYHDNDFLIPQHQFVMYHEKDEWRIYIKMPRLKCDLLQWAEDKKKSLVSPTLAEIANILYNATCALEYLHSKDIAHQNLKPQNILLDDKNLSYITDIRCQLSPEDEDQPAITRPTDNKRYRSPELSNTMHKLIDWMRADVWALGMIIIDLCVDNLPKKMKKTQIIDIKGEILGGLEFVKSKFSEDLYEILAMMVCITAEERISFKDLKGILSTKLGKHLISVRSHFFA